MLEALSKVPRTVVLHSCKPNTGEVGAGGSKNFKSSLGYVRTCLKINN